MARCALWCVTTVVILAVGCVPPVEVPDPQLPDRAKLPLSATAPERAGVGQTVTLTAAADTAGAVPPVTYAWFQYEGPGVALTGAATATASFVAPSLPEDRVLRFTATVSDMNNGVGSASVSVLVAADPNYAENNSGGDSGTEPVAKAKLQPETIEEGFDVTLDAGESKGIGLKYSWVQTEGPDVTITDDDRALASFVAPGYRAQGINELEFELTITDSRGRTATDTVTVTITEMSRTRVRIETTLGTFTIELYPDEAPVTVENFLQYVDDDFYAGTVFHRVIPDFVVQGGGFEPGGVQKETRDPIELEAGNGLLNDRSWVAMARTNDPDSATSQWYVNLVDNEFLNQSADSDGYAVFGRVVQGMDVVDKIAEEETDDNDQPIDDVLLQSAERVTDVSQDGTHLIAGEEDPGDTGKSPS